jgi:hypothetical protein
MEKRRKLGFAVNEASRVLHEMDPVNYPQADHGRGPSVKKEEPI